MSGTNTPENFFYDSDEDVAWGPITLREIKRDLKTGKRIPPNYRRQTASFITCSNGNNSDMFTIANSSHSSKDYFTANESLDSNNLNSKEEIPAVAGNNSSKNNFTPGCLVNSPTETKMAIIEDSEVIALSSDSEDDVNQSKELCNEKSQRFSYSQSTHFSSFSSGKESSNDVIYLSSSEDEEYEPQKDETTPSAFIQDQSMDSLEEEQTLKVQSIANTPVKKDNYSSDQDSSFSYDNESSKRTRQTPRIRIITRTPVKNDSNSSFIDRKQNFSFVELESDTSYSEKPIKQSNFSLNRNDSFKSVSPHSERKVKDNENLSDDSIDTPERELNYSSDNFTYRDHFLNEKHVKTQKVEELNKSDFKINIISNTPIKGPNLIQEDDCDIQETSSVDDQKIKKSREPSMNCIDIAHASFNNRNLSLHSPETVGDISYGNRPPVLSNNSSRLSQNENEYDYCEEINHTLSSKLEQDLSLKESEVCNTSHKQASSRLDLSGIHSLDTNTSDDTNNYSCKELDDTKNESISTQSNNEHHNEDISCLNDTFAEMERLLTEGFDSDSEDSSEELVDSTSLNHPRPAFGNTSIQNISRIPIPKSFSEDSKDNSSVRSEFKIPKLPPKIFKKTPVSNRLIASKISPSSLKNIVSPVRLYINNSPVAALKQTNKPACTKSLCYLPGISEGSICGTKKRRNLLDSLPEVVYKPSRLVREMCDKQIILPNNIRKLITERIVIKHEPRRRINPDESIFSVGDKLSMKDLSVIVSDDQNMSVHTTKQGFNL